MSLFMDYYWPFKFMNKVTILELSIKHIICVSLCIYEQESNLIALILVKLDD